MGLVMKSKKPDGLLVLAVIFVLGLMVGAASFHSGQAEAGVTSVKGVEHLSYQQPGWQSSDR